MTLSIEGVPTEIPRAAVCDLVRSLGVDPDVVISMHFSPRSITVEAYALNEQAQRFVGADGTHPATHLVTIPIV